MAFPVKERHQNGFLKFLLVVTLSTAIGLNVAQIGLIFPLAFSAAVIGMLVVVVWIIIFIFTYKFYGLLRFANLSNKRVAGLIMLIIFLFFFIIPFESEFHDEEYARQLDLDREREEREREREEREREREERESEERSINLPSIIRDWEPDWAKGEDEETIKLICYIAIEETDRDMLDIMLNEDKDFSWCIEYMDGKRP